MVDVPSLLRTYRGQITRIAEELGVTPWAVCKWKRIPAERVLEVERIIGISRHILRPDLYPPSEYGQRARNAGFRARSGS